MLSSLAGFKLLMDGFGVVPGDSESGRGVDVLSSLAGFKLLMDVFGVVPGTVSQGVELMRQGHLLAIAPGIVNKQNETLLSY